MKKFSNSLKKWFDSKPVYNEKYLKTKIKSYEGKINTNFHNNKIPKQGSQCTCLSAISIDSIFRIRKKKWQHKISSDNSDEENSNEENSDDEN